MPKRKKDSRELTLGTHPAVLLQKETFLMSLNLNSLKNQIYLSTSYLLEMKKKFINQFKVQENMLIKMKVNLSMNNNKY